MLSKIKLKLTALATSLVLLGCGGGEHKSVVLLGDSLSALPAWCASYPRCPGKPVGDVLLEKFGGGSNLSTAGETTRHALYGGEVLAPGEVRVRKYAKVSDLRGVDILVLRYCVADLVTGLEPQQIVLNISSIVKTVGATQTFVITCSPVLLPNMPEKVAETNRLLKTLKDVIILDVGGDTEPMQDKMHPEPALVEKQLEAISKQLKYFVN